MRYEKPDRLEDALGLLAEGRWRILAGGTDFYPGQGSGPVVEDILDINGIGELRGITRSEHGLSIGAGTTWSDVARAELPPALHGLQQAARQVGGIQIQNGGTVAGNLCNASPAADGVPPLLTLDAEVELRSAGGARRLPLQEFILGNRRTARRGDELLSAIHLPAGSVAGTGSFVKLGARRYLVISIAMAAARIEVEDGRIASAAVAVGACSEVAQRLDGVERALAGCGVDVAVETILSPAHFSGLRPIDDVRGSAAYRQEAVREIVRRAVAEALRDALRPKLGEAA